MTPAFAILLALDFALAVGIAGVAGYMFGRSHGYDEGHKEGARWASRDAEPTVVSAVARGA
jgi:hypothetical protein